MDHIIAEGMRIYQGTGREHTWLIYHDHLKIWWEKESQDYLKSLPCPIEGNPSRTWWDRQIKICGETNNAKVAKTYKNCLPGDSPELMPLDCHLFADVQEGAAKNVALTYHIRDGHADAALKYSFATPHKVFDAIQRTICAGCPSPSRIAEDINRVWEETLARIVDAQGTYIEEHKTARRGVRALHAAEVRKRSEPLPVDAAATNAFLRMVKEMKEGNGVTFTYDLTGEEGDGQGALDTTLERNVVTDEWDEDEDGGEDE
jgi:hypothetical protein